jgi:hypothetical protein
MTATKKEVLTLNEILSSIQVRLKANKSKFNGFGKYNYRSAEDILEAVKPFLTEFGVTVRINERMFDCTGLPMMESLATLSDGTDSISAIACVGIDLNQKGMNVPQQFGSASSYAKKYSLGNLFLIDDTQDSDATNDHGKGGGKVQPQTEKVLLAGEALTKAIEFVKNGGDIESIKKKYKVTPAIEKQLTI